MSLMRMLPGIAQQQAPSGGGGGGGVVFRGGSNTSVSNGVAFTSFTVPYPAGLQSGDVVFIAVAFEDDAVADATPTITGFTQIASVRSTPISLRVFQGSGFSGTGNWTVTLDNAAYGQCACTAWSGADGASVVVGSALNAGADGSGNFTVPSVTTTAVGENLLVVYQRYASAYPTSTTPAHTERARANSVSLLSLADASIGATGTVAGVGSAWNAVQALQIAIPEA